MRGRKPKPPGLSTRQPDRPKDGPLVRLPACPPHLQGEARKEWSRVGKKLLAYGLVTEIDRSALAIYCQAWARWVEAEQQLGKYGTVIKSPTGYPMQSPYLAIANKAMEQMAKILVEFGMSPSSRSRVAAVRQPTGTPLRIVSVPRAM
ncbi:MAG: phage terminase small subunit P27 family [Chloroflexi bacterium]|nr:phage terminase small subunit P27 family [Chloroflexota bacterium]